MKKIIPPLIVSAVIVLILRIISFFPFEHSQLIYSAASIVLLIGGSFILKLFQEKKTRNIRFFKLRFAKRKDFPIVIWMTATLITGSFLLNLLVINIFSALGSDVGGNMLTAYDTENMWLSLLTIAVIPAVTEEFFFRGATLSVLSKEKTAFALFVSAALFALAHGSLYMLPSSFYAGLIFGLTVYITDSVYTSMVIHFLNNIMAYILFRYGSILYNAGFEDGLLFITVLLFLVALYGALSVIARSYKRALKENKPILNEGEILWEKRKEKRSSKKPSN